MKTVQSIKNWKKKLKNYLKSAIKSKENLIHLESKKKKN